VGGYQAWEEPSLKYHPPRFQTKLFGDKP